MVISICLLAAGVAFCFFHVLEYSVLQLVSLFRKKSGQNLLYAVSLFNTGVVKLLYMICGLCNCFFDII